MVGIAGNGRVNAVQLERHHIVGFDPGPGTITVEADVEPVHVLVGGGTPLRMPSHWIGGIAMSTPERSAEATDRYRSGDFGELTPSF